MKSRISKKLSLLKSQNKKAFIPYITAGFPSLKTTENLILMLETSGASIIELGVPFTDPMADGPVIQKSNEIVLKNGVTLKQILSLVKRVRQKTQIPILLMGYYNPFFQYGINKLAKDCNNSGVDGLLVVDLPPEEAIPLQTALKNVPVDLIYLLSPTSNDTRIKLVKKHGSGFVYYVSLTGVTGSLTINAKHVQSKIKQIRKQINLPINIGFGISKPDHVKNLAPIADGVIVGSSLIKLIFKYKNQKKMLGEVKRYVESLVNAL